MWFKHLENHESEIKESKKSRKKEDIIKKKGIQSYKRRQNIANKRQNKKK